jgi:hypothetical protein
MCPLAEYLGGRVERGDVDTNQCLFWGPDETFDLLTERFPERRIPARSRSGLRSARS